MNLKKRVASVALGTAFVAAMAGLATAAESTGRWIHIRVLERGDRQESVRVNLPLSVLQTMATAIESEHVRDGRVQFGETGLKPDQLRAMWQSVKSSRDMEFVTVESADESIKVAKSGNFLVARLRGSGGDRDGDRVDVKIPMSVLDALLDAPRGELNVKAALEALGSQDSGDLVTVLDGDSDIRIWIDGRSDTED